MDHASRAGKTEELINEIQSLVYHPTPRLFSLVKKLERQIPEEGDHTLQGSCHFWRACAYYVKGSHKSFFRSLKPALYYLLRSNDPEKLARAFNLYGIEVQRLGCMDVAYHSLRTAYSYVKNNPDSLVRAIVEANTGDLLAEMDDPKGACVHIRRAIPVFRRLEKNTESGGVLNEELINLGLYSLSSNDLRGARLAEQELAGRIAVTEEPVTDRTGRFYLLFRARMALANADRKEMLRLTGQVISQIVLQPGTGEFAKDIYRFCRQLISAKERAAAAELVASLEKQPEINASAHASLLLAGLQVDYYRAAGNKKKMMEAYDRRNRLFALQKEDERMVYNESIELMRLAVELKEEQARAREENNRLRRLAETDALTCLPNRYAINRKLEETFHRAVTSRSALGIGVVDIDAFKQYNDTHGHKEGDRCLCAVADAVRRFSEKKKLFCARYGGDEFLLIYEGMTDTQIRRLEKELVKTIPIPATHGFFNTHPTEQTMLWSLFSEADRVLYGKKRKRGSR